MLIKRISAFLVIGVLLFALFGCGGGNGFKIDNAQATQKDVTVTLKTATAQRMKSPDRYEYTLGGTIENNSDEGIMEVIYTIAFYDKNGEEFRSFGLVYDGMDEPIPPHTSVDFYHDNIKWGAQSVPASVSIGISTVMTEQELPPANIPQEGEYLYKALGDEKLANIKEEPPVELRFHVDQSGYGRTATFTEGELLDEAVKLLCDITIAGESNEDVTDNYNSIMLKWADGTTSRISLNLYDLEYYIHSIPHGYRLEHLEGFWSFASAYLEEDE